ncbi:hypothetical protein J1605_020311 [Eschrichtius robustus]|uniref:Nuclear transcription factor Y subunit beta n=1 Tax=Eschrichtius robustus TaxID=9764 RepID=A0AB34HJ08_ESCRO|nr:hypothetical protein J1605_020311 [Eschrichtius robustus]
MKCPSPPGAVPAANAAAAGGTRLPPARPPARAGAGAGRAPARPVPLRARPRSERGAVARLFVRGVEERRDAGQAAPFSPPPQSSGPEAEEGAPGHRRAPLSAASRPAPFCAESRPGGGGTQPGPPAPILTPGPGRRAGMDGDSSTTDASQLGISADYIGGSHYVIQPHDDTEDSMNDHEDTNGSKESFREQDIYLPIANVARIMKNAIPQTGKIAKDAKECVQECVSEFISFITSEASERCHQEKRKTINGEDILFAMSTLGFDSYVEPLKLYLQKFREAMKGEKGIGGAVTATDGLSEELTEEAFSKQCYDTFVQLHSFLRVM